MPRFRQVPVRDLVFKNNQTLRIETVAHRRAYPHGPFVTSLHLAVCSRDGRAATAVVTVEGAYKIEHSSLDTPAAAHDALNSMINRTWSRDYKMDSIVEEEDEEKDKEPSGLARAVHLQQLDPAESAAFAMMKDQQLDPADLPSSLEDFIDLVKACYMSLQPPAASAGGRLLHVPASRIAEIRQNVVDKFGRGVLPSHESKSPGSGQKVMDKDGRGLLPNHESKSPGSGEVSSAAPAALPSPGSSSSSSAGEDASSSSAAASVPPQVVVDFRQAGWAPHLTVVPTHYTSLDVANILEAEGCVGAYEHISNGPWATFTMEDLMLDPNDPYVVFS